MDFPRNFTQALVFFFASVMFRIVNWQRHLIPALIAVMVFSVVRVRAEVSLSQNPYAPIVTRNVFGLVPIPEPAPPVDPATLVPPPKITPNGIMTLFGKLQVLFKVAGVAHPGQPPKDESYVMGEGDRQDEIEVQKIDEKAATITFNNHGVVQSLALVTGTASAGGAAPAPAGFTPPGIPRPGLVPGAGVGFGGRFGRNRNLPPAVNPVDNNPNVGGGAPSFGGGNANSVNTDASQEQITPETQVIMMEAQRAQWKQEGNPAAAILPPTPITSQLNGEDGNRGGPPVPGQ